MFANKTGELYLCWEFLWIEAFGDFWFLGGVLVGGFGMDIRLFTPLVSGFPSGFCVHIVSTACSRRMSKFRKSGVMLRGVHSGVYPLFLLPGPVLDWVSHIYLILLSADSSG